MITKANLDYIFNFTTHYLRGAECQSDLASKIEKERVDLVSQADRFLHMGCVVSSLVLSASALESEVWSVVNWGPGFHLGSNGVDETKKDLLNFAFSAKSLRNMSTASKYAKVLEVCGRKSFDKNAEVFRNIDLVCCIRNRLVHYESLSGSDYAEHSVVDRLRGLGLEQNPIYSHSDPLFPHRLLGSACAKWATQSTIEFLNEFYLKLGIQRVF